MVEMVGTETVDNNKILNVNLTKKILNRYYKNYSSDADIACMEKTADMIAQLKVGDTISHKDLTRQLRSEGIICDSPKSKIVSKVIRYLARKGMVSVNNNGYGKPSFITILQDPIDMAINGRVEEKIEQKATPTEQIKNETTPRPKIIKQKATGEKEVCDVLSKLYVGQHISMKMLVKKLTNIYTRKSVYYHVYQTVRRLEQKGIVKVSKLNKHKANRHNSKASQQITIFILRDPKEVE